MHVCMHAYIRTYIHTHAHTHAHIGMHYIVYSCDIRPTHSEHKLADKRMVHNYGELVQVSGFSSIGVVYQVNVHVRNYQKGVLKEDWMRCTRQKRVFTEYDTDTQSLIES